MAGYDDIAVSRATEELEHLAVSKNCCVVRESMGPAILGQGDLMRYMPLLRLPFPCMGDTHTIGVSHVSFKRETGS
jgi:hypothetical protein